MLKLKKKLLAMILAAAIVLSTGTGIVWSESAEDNLSDDLLISTEGGEDAAADGEEAAADGEEAEADGEEAEDEETPRTADEAFAEMVLYAENTNLALYVNETTCEFAIENKSNGYIWWSNPFDLDTDPIAGNVQKQSLRSLLSYQPLDIVENLLNRINTYSYESSVRSKLFTLEKIENGVKFTFEFVAHKFTIPLYVTLLEDSFEARIPATEIIEEPASAGDASEYKLVTLSLLQHLGAGRTDETGYILIPDGSGAVIEFNNGKTSTTTYRAQVYGKDAAISTATAPTKTEQVYLPVLGIVKEDTAGDNALFAVVTEGDSYAYVNANVSGQASTSYNSAWFSFEFRANDTYTIGTRDPLNVFQQGDIRTGDIAIRYYVMDDDEINYADLAETYRNYLINEKNLTQQTTSDANALYLTTMGGTVKLQSILGFPVNKQTTATTYSQALEILQELQSRGVDDITLIYNDFDNAGVNGEISTGMNYAGALGGKNAYEELNNYVTQNNFTIYPSIDFMEYTNSGNGYSFTLNASKRITNAYATQTAFYLHYGVPNTDSRSTWTILSPYYWTDVFRKVIESFKAEGITTISLTQATEMIYSDFSRQNLNGESQILRHDSIEILQNGLQALKDAGIEVLAQGCNAYALPYVSGITNVPLYSSNFDLFDYDVPFYQMVIHGYIPYSSKPVNASANADEMILLSMLSGSGVHYEMMYADPQIFSESEYENYFYAYYFGWLDDAAQNYQMINDVISSFSDKTITNYTRTSADELSAEYSDGTIVSVNLTSEIITVGGQEINLADYELKGESD